MLAWQFCTSTVKAQSGMCVHDLYAFERLMDALNHACSALLHRIHLSGTIVRRNNRLVATAYTSLWTMDTTEILHLFARQCAMDAITVSGWHAPPVVIEYLQTERGDLWSSAREMAWAAAAATGDAMETTAKTAAREAAWAAAMATAWAAAGSAARATAWDAAWAAARAATWAAARTTKGNTIWTNARTIAQSTQNDLLTNLVITNADIFHRPNIT